MDISVYESQLCRRMWLYGTLCALLIILFLVCLFFVHRNAPDNPKNSPKDLIEKRIYQWMMYILCILGMAGCLFFGGSTVWKCSEDINNQSYIIWEGDITVIQDGPTKSRWYLPDEEGIKLEGEGLGEGVYTGKVVYAENSRVVLEYWIDDSSE